MGLLVFGERMEEQGYSQRLERRVGVGISTSEYCNYDPPNDKAMIDSQEALTRLLVRIIEVTAGSKARKYLASALDEFGHVHRPSNSPQQYKLERSLCLERWPPQRCLWHSKRLGPVHRDGHDRHRLHAAMPLQGGALSAQPIKVSLPGVLAWLLPLLQSSYTAFYAEATDLLRATIETLELHGAFDDNTIPNVLLDGRLSLRTRFSFSLASIIFKGVRHNHLKSSAETVLRSLLSVAVRCGEQPPDGAPYVLSPDALGYFVALIPFSTTRDSYVRLLQDCRAEEFLPATGPLHDNDFVPRVSVEMLPVTDSTAALLVVSFATTMLTTAQGDDAETEMLYNLLLDVRYRLSRTFVNDVRRLPLSATDFDLTDALHRSYEMLQDRIKEAFAVSGNASIIRAVSNIFRISQDPLRLSTMRGGSMSTLGTVEEGSITQGLKRRLEDLNMDGLTTSFQFLPPNWGQWTRIAAWISELVLKIVGLE
ncbi:hypothetical protein BU15DRAFT_62309 [Melanogaster broomeanus]|nr:hypothetical protein BU15DRAFT_62309 [Melanogaster broomeanus]